MLLDSFIHLLGKSINCIRDCGANFGFVVSSDDLDSSMRLTVIN